MRPPPNSAELFRIRRAGRIPTPGPFAHVAVLPEWNLEVAGAYVYAPPEIDPLELDFSFVAGLDVAIFFRRGGECQTFDNWLLSTTLAVMSGDPATVTCIDLVAAERGLGRAIVARYVRGPNVE